jgi:molecular chaperone GrpE
MSKKHRDPASEIDATPEAAAAAEAAEAADAAGPEAGSEPEPGDEVETLRNQLADLHVQLADLQTEVAEQVDRRLRTAAELENLRKRSRREVDNARRFAQADILRPLLDVLDNFERALQYTPAEADTEPAPVDSFRQGVELIAQNFRQVLLDCGVRRIEAVGRAFDPALHEAVGQAPSADGAERGAIMAEVQAGYTLDDLVLRASRVIVAQ